MQVDRRYGHRYSGPGIFGIGVQQDFDPVGAQRLLGIDQASQDRINLRLALPGRQLEDEQVLTAGHGLAVGPTQRVVGDTEARCRKQVVPVPVVGESARFMRTSWSMMWRYWIRWPPLPRSRGIRSRWR